MGMESRKLEVDQILAAFYKKIILFEQSPSKCQTEWIQLALF